MNKVWEQNKIENICSNKYPFKHISYKIKPKINPNGVLTL